MSETFSELSLELSNKVPNNDVEIAIEELAAKYRVGRAIKESLYYYYNERNNNLVLQFVLNSEANEFKALRDFLDRKESELCSYQRLITEGKKVVHNTRKELIEFRMRNNDLSLRNEFLEELIGSLEVHKKRHILLSRGIDKKSVKDTQLENRREIEQFETFNSALEDKKYQDKLKSLEDSLNLILEENKKTYDMIYNCLKSLENWKKPWWWKPIKKTVNGCNNIFGTLKNLF